MEYNEEFTQELFELLRDRNLGKAQLEEVTALLECGADPNFQQTSYPNETPLFRALASRKAETRLALVEKLIASGVDINTEAKGSYPLLQAVGKGDATLVSLFIKHKVSEGLGPALSRAIEKDNLEIVETLLPLWEDLAVDDSDSFLSSCCEAYRCRDRKQEYEVTPGMRMAELLLSSGVRADGAALFSAIQHDFLELTELLLKHGATLAQASIHQPALFTARSVAMAQLLITAGADLQERSAAGETVLMHQFMDVKMEMVEFFIAQGVDLYAVGEDGATAFHLAGRYEDTQTLEQLSKHYDIARCDKLLPLLKYLDDAEPHLLSFIAQKLGTDQNENPLALADLLTPGTQALDSEFAAKATRLAEQLALASPGIKERLPPFESFLRSSVFDRVLEQLGESLTEWLEACAGSPLQALYMEYGGDVVSPFDSMSLIYGYQSCDESLALKKEIFEAGTLNLSVFFDGIAAMLEEFEDSYTEITDYYQALAFRYVNLAFGKLVTSEEFASLPVQLPFYVVGAAHDGEARLVFKHV